MAWLITVHNGGGSMVEAATPDLAWSAANEQDAVDIAEKVNDWLQNNNMTDCWTDIIPVPSTHADVATALKETAAEYAHAAGSPNPFGSPFGGAIGQLLQQAGIPQGPSATIPPVPTPVQIQQPCVCCGEETLGKSPSPDHDGDLWCTWCSNSPGCDKVGGTHDDPPTPEELAIAAAAEKQAQFDAYMLDTHSKGVRLVINHPGLDGEKLVLDHTHGIPLLFVPGRRLKLQYNHENPLDPANGERFDVQVYIDGVRRKGKASIVINEVKATLPKAHRTENSASSDALEHAVQVAKGHREVMERRQRFESTEATEDIPDDIKAQLAALLGGKS